MIVEDTQAIIDLLNKTVMLKTNYVKHFIIVHVTCKRTEIIDESIIVDHYQQSIHVPHNVFFFIDYHFYRLISIIDYQCIDWTTPRNKVNLLENSPFF